MATIFFLWQKGKIRCAITQTDEHLPFYSALLKFFQNVNTANILFLLQKGKIRCVVTQTDEHLPSFSLCI